VESERTTDLGGGYEISTKFEGDPGIAGEYVTDCSRWEYYAISPDGTRRSIPCERTGTHTNRSKYLTSTTIIKPWIVRIEGERIIITFERVFRTPESESRHKTVLSGTYSPGGTFRLDKWTLNGQLMNSRYEFISITCTILSSNALTIHNESRDHNGHYTKGTATLVRRK
jgi:hypothetical protein